MGEKAVGSGLFERLEQEARFWRELGLEAEIERWQHGNRFFYRCAARLAVTQETGDDGAEASLGLEAAEIVRVGIASAIYDTVLDEIEPLILLRSVTRLRPGYGAEEATRVANAARRIAQRLHADPFSERNRVMERILDYLLDFNLLLLDGFIHFRLKDYLDELMDCVRQAVDDLEVEKEREELVTLLKDFVQARPASVDTVHVLLGEDHSLRLLDQRGTPLSTGAFDDWEGVLGSGGHGGDVQPDIDELLISALITIAPGRIVCHRPIHARDIPMVVDVFTGRLDACPGCELCQGRAAPDARPRLT